MRGYTARRSVDGGQVYLVGAGPGDPGLLTLRGAEILHAAEAVLHDRLVSPGVLALAAPGAELLDVGHRAGEPPPDPDRVAEAMAARWRAGQVVCRLKGGDPFVFGRGGEEALALARRRVPFEVVPGVSSAIAAPAAAGIPVTHRGLARSLLVVTGHGPALRWEVLRADTVVVLMGAARAGAIAGAMVAAGWGPDTPAALVAAATTPAQRLVRGRLGDIDRRPDGPATPAVLVVGAVTTLAEELAAAALAATGG